MSAWSWQAVSHMRLTTHGRIEGKNQPPSEPRTSRRRKTLHLVQKRIDLRARRGRRRRAIAVGWRRWPMAADHSPWKGTSMWRESAAPVKWPYCLPGAMAAPSGRARIAAVCSEAGSHAFVTSRRGSGFAGAALIAYLPAARLEAHQMADRLRVAHTVSDLRLTIRSWRAEAESIALVPTMGALHAGHVAFVREAQRRAQRAVVSIFVNPAQFAPARRFRELSPKPRCRPRLAGRHRHRPRLGAAGMR